ncbi:hypothetical protein [Actinomadura sp. 21ATH]|uniref:hypothetical protein n=1 Tax=Actinomadura sp. 21ATH TaxID=1735444 RepID=UPI0035C0BBC2
MSEHYIPTRVRLAWSQAAADEASAADQDRRAASLEAEISGLQQQMTALKDKLAVARNQYALAGREQQRYREDAEAGREMAMAYCTARDIPVAALDAAPAPGDTGPQPAVPDEATCQKCNGEVARWVGGGWRHVDGPRDHAAEPAGDPLERSGAYPVQPAPSADTGSWTVPDDAYPDPTQTITDPPTRSVPFRPDESPGQGVVDGPPHQATPDPVRALTDLDTRDGGTDER